MNKVAVYENYRNYIPPHGVRSSIENLLSAIPKEFLGGLESVVLTNSESIGKGKTYRIKGRKYSRRACAGFYHRRHKGNQPWIEIVVDKALNNTPNIILWIPAIRAALLSDTLFHELGHHLDATVGSPAPSGEAAAEAWKKRLSKTYFRKRCWYIIGPLKLILSPFKELQVASFKLGTAHFEVFNLQLVTYSLFSEWNAWESVAGQGALLCCGLAEIP
jgi:hypothetical protein